jgi:hypothetical protein
MADKFFLLVCEGPTDIYIFEALAAHFSDFGTKKLQIITLAPQLDATSGTYPPHGFDKVLNWCAANRKEIQKLIDFRGANALFVQMDTDIAKQANPGCINQGHSARHCCQEKINDRLGTTQEPPRCYYILPTQNTETWILASQQPPELDANSTEISNYELITDTEQRLIKRLYPSKNGRKRNVRKLKNPARKYKKYGKQLTTNLTLARQRCAELNRLCILLEIATGTILMTSAEKTSRPYFRRDQRDGISPPDLSKECTFAEHIVHARGKRTQYTSVSLDPKKIKDFGDTTYRLNRQPTEADKHIVIEHDSLLTELQRTIREQDKADRARAIQALRYATQRQEGLVKWQFDISRLERKEMIAWATTKVQIYFTKV